VVLQFLQDNFAAETQTAPRVARAILLYDFSITEACESKVEVGNASCTGGPVFVGSESDEDMIVYLERARGVSWVALRRKLCMTFQWLTEYRRGHKLK